MSKIIIPEGYKSTLNLYDTQTAIGLLKRTFEDKLRSALNLKRVSAPLFVTEGTGINDDLNGIEHPVSFEIADAKTTAVVVFSLAKWKRYALYRYGFKPGEGLYTDMNAIRRDEELDNLHSVYTDQWDWEKVITPEDRTLEYLKDTVRKEVDAVCETLSELKKAFPQIKTELSDKVSFVTTQELEDMYPELSPKERENEYLRKHKTAFIMQIGDILRSGIKHDGRAPDYDDWKLNGDIVFWNDLLNCAFEISSMGIRVDPKTLDEQLSKAGADERRGMLFHSLLLQGKLPLSIGGGIGQSRLSMLLLGKAHIGEVQTSVWDRDTVEACEKAGIVLL